MQDHRMSLWEHLAELRRRLIVAVLAWAVAAVGVFVYAKDILNWLVRPLGHPLIFTGVSEAFLATLRIAVMGGLVLASPVILYQLAAFVLPGLTREERRLLVVLLPAGLGLFGLGAAFAYVILLPRVFAWLLSFTSANLQAMITVGAYLSFTLGLIIPVGLVFELPLLVIGLARVGLVSPQVMARYRGYAYLMFVVLAAVVTPPDMLSQILVSAPMIVLYELSLLLARWAYRVNTGAGRRNEG